MIRVTANEYLDRRKPEWVDAEMFGHVRYNRENKLAEIEDPRRDIQRACGGAL